MGDKNYFAYGDAETVLTEFAADIKNKVDKVNGKGLSTNDYTTTEKNKLAGIAEGAQVNAVTGVKGSNETAYRTGDVSISKSNIGLANVDNKSSATIRSEITASNVTTALGYTPLNATQKGANSGVAELDANGKVPTSQLPSYVDDVIEGYYYNSKFYTTSAHTAEITPESGKIYVDLSSNKTYRYSGSAYVEISASLALGETSSTAYRGDRGKTAYDHASAKGAAYSSGFYKIMTNSEGHVTGAVSVTKSDITGLGIPSENTTYSEATTSAAGLMSSTDKTKLNGIASGAEVNVQSDWSVTTTSSDAYIKNKPSSLPASDVYSWAKASTKPTYTKSEIGLSNVDNTADADKTVSKANTLTTARYIDGISFDGSGDVNHFGICSTAASTTAKVVSVTGSPTLANGTRIIVRFQYANTASNPTLNVNSLGAKGIKLSNSSSSSAQGSNAGNTTWGAGYVLEFVYANNYWIVVRGENATASYDGLMSAADKTKLDGIASGAQVNSVTGVKGNSESSYRTGNINITKANIGLGNVDNTADANKSVNYAATAGSLSENAVLKTQSDNNPNFNNIPANIGAGNLQFREITGTSATNAPADYTNSDNPWAHLFTMVHNNSTSYYTQLLLGMTYNGIHYRNGQSGWRKVFDTGNCPIQRVPEDYVTDRTGTHFVKFANGFCVQWGFDYNILGEGTTATISFPYAFTDTPVVVANKGFVTSVDNGSFNIQVESTSSGSLRYIAVGYIE